MTILQIECFLALYDTLNFTKAAQSVFLTQPNFSRQIAALEEELGDKLFERTTRAVRPTAAAKLIWEDLRPIPHMIKKAQVKIEAAHRGDTGRLQIGILDTLDPELHYIKKLRKYLQSHTELTVNVKLGAMQDLIFGLRNGEFDLLLTLRVNRIYQKGLSVQTLIRQNMAFAISKNSKWYVPGMNSIAELTGVPIAVLTQPGGMPDYEQTLNLSASLGFFPEKLIMATSASDKLFQVESGMAAAMLNRHTRLEDNPDIAWIPIDSKGHGDLVAISLEDNKNPVIENILAMLLQVDS